MDVSAQRAKKQRGIGQKIYTYKGEDLKSNISKTKRVSCAKIIETQVEFQLVSFLHANWGSLWNQLSE